MCNASRVAPHPGARLLKALCLVSTALLALPQAAQADVTLLEQGNVTVEGGLTAGIAALSVGNANLGAGVRKPDGGVQKDRNWTEAFIAPSGKVTVNSESVGAFYTGFRIVGSGTGGDGDAGGNVQGRQGRFDMDNLFLGWKSGSLFPSLGDNAIDVSAGRQPFTIGDGFIIGDGTFDTGRMGGYWLGPRRGWGLSSVVARVDVKPVHLDLFRLKSDKNSFVDVIYGGNLEWRGGEDGKLVVGGSYMNIDESRLASRKGMDIVSLRAQGAFVPNVPDLSLSAEYVKERNNRSATKLDASAWYGEAAYTLSDLPWTPRLSYRYSSFSGDKSGTAKNEAFDPLHLAFPRWGTWLQGEIAGQYFPNVNSNLSVNTIQIAVQPSETVTLTGLFYNFRFNEKPTGVTSSDFGNEVNLAVDWQATPNLLVSGAVGRFFAGDGGRQQLGGRKDTTLAEITAIVTF